MKIFKKDTKFKQQIRKLAVVKQLKHNDLLNTIDAKTKSDKLLFTNLAINEMILKSLKAMKLSHATDIQGKVLEHALQFRDILASEKTGSGKTLAYLIPLLNLVLKFQFRLHHGTCAIVLVPSKELCVQVCSVFGQLCQFTNVRYGLINGEKVLKEEERNLALGCTVLIATPAALLRHIKESITKKESDGVEYFRYHNLRYLVLDEADRLMQDSQIDVMHKILDTLPRSRQTLVLSATLNLDFDDSLDRINTFAQKTLSDQFVRINVPKCSQQGLDAPKNATVDNLIEGYVLVEPSKRILFLFNLIRRVTNKKVMIFLGSSEEVEFYFNFLNLLNINNQSLMMMHSNLSNELRTSTLIKYSQLTSCFMLCTDVVSRGIDIPMVDLVVQFDVAHDLSSYIHRVGRTARGDTEGTAIIVLRPSESDTVLTHLKKVSVSLIEFEMAQLNDITDFFQQLPRGSPLLKLAESALTCQMKAYRESKLTPESLVHLNIKDELVNFCLENAPKMPKLFRKELKISVEKEKTGNK